MIKKNPNLYTVFGKFYLCLHKLYIVFIKCTEIKIEVWRRVLNIIDHFILFNAQLRLWPKKKNNKQPPPSQTKKKQQQQNVNNYKCMHILISILNAIRICYNCDCFSNSVSDIYKYMLNISITCSQKMLQLRQCFLSSRLQYNTHMPWHELCKKHYTIILSELEKKSVIYYWISNWTLAWVLFISKGNIFCVTESGWSNPIRSLNFMYEFFCH